MKGEPIREKGVDSRAAVAANYFLLFDACGSLMACINLTFPSIIADEVENNKNK
jgi:hypothetical protein